MRFFLTMVIRFLGLLPLPLLHLISYLLGTILFYSSYKTRKITMTNLKYSEIITDYTKINSFALKIYRETIKTSFELTIALTRSTQHIQTLFHQINGWSLVKDAILQKKGILFITPHLGSFDLAGRVLAELMPFPVTVLFKPPKIKYLRPIIKNGRERGNVLTAGTNQSGVKKILLALKNKQGVILLPDQVPDSGEGTIVNFFKHPAYTMTLAAKLTQLPDIIPLFFIGERLPNSKGFNLHIYPLTEPLTDNLRSNIQIINHQIEKLIKLFPKQYLFSYNRYKIPAGCEKK